MIKPITYEEVLQAVSYYDSQLTSEHIKIINRNLLESAEGTHAPGETIFPLKIDYLEIALLINKHSDATRQGIIKQYTDWDIKTDNYILQFFPKNYIIMHNRLL